MASSIGNYALPYPRIQPAPNPPQPHANDIHIKAAQGNLDVVGVEGVAPEAPNATFNVEGQGTGQVSLSDIKVRPGGELHVRLRSNGPNLPKVTITWTIDGNQVRGTGETTHEHAAVPLSDGAGGGEHAALLEIFEEFVTVLKERLPLATAPVIETQR